MKANNALPYITQLICNYYQTFCNETIKISDIQQKCISDILYHSLYNKFSYFDKTINHIAIFDFPYERYYVIMDDMKWFYDIINNILYFSHDKDVKIHQHDVIFSIGIVPFESLDITHNTICKIMNIVLQI